MNDEDLMIIGAKKRKDKEEFKDKNDYGTCVSAFYNLILTTDTNTKGFVNKDALISLSLSGDVDKNFIRPSLWKLLLGVLPHDVKIEEWPEIIHKQRVEYKKKLKGLSSLKKFAGDPLGNSNDSGWNSFFEEAEIKKIINLDVNRTYQDKELFQLTLTKEIMFNILFLWSKDNKDIAYKQGMNEILAVLLNSLYPFYFKQLNKKTKDEIIEYIKSQDYNKYANEIYCYFHDEDEFQADLFVLFNKVMTKGMKELFDTGSMTSNELRNYKKFELFTQHWTEDDIEDEEEKHEPPLNRRCKRIIKQKLKMIDEELLDHFKKIEMNCTIFLQRWLKCIFNREFHPKDVMIIWDSIFAHDFKDIGDKTVNTSSTVKLEFMDFVAVAMITYIREDLLKKDQNDCFQRLFKYPPIETPVTLITLADQIKNLYDKKEKKREEELLKKGKTVCKNQAKSKEHQRPSYLTSLKSNNTSDRNNNSKSSTNTNSNISNVQLGNNIPSSDLDSSTVGMNMTNTDNLQSETKKMELTEEHSVEIVGRLEDIFKKYQEIFESDDASDFEVIIKYLKSNLVDQND